MTTTIQLRNCLGPMVASLLLGLILLPACGRLDAPPVLDADPQGAKRDAGVAPDNTAINQRDVTDWLAKTPPDQNETHRDIQITAEIRRRILDTDPMSVNARNIKIITANGKVTLRGPADSQVERETLVKIAEAVAGEGNVDDKIEVIPP